MAAQPKVIALGLEEVVLDVRRDGKTLDEMVEACNADLTRRGIDKTVARSSIERYLARLDKASVPAAHTPQAAKANATLAVDVAARINQLDTVLQRWLTEADEATVPMQIGSGEMATMVDVTDWRARLGVTKQIREHAEFVTNLLERLFNVAQVEAFQATVLQAIEEADPDTARAIVREMAKRSDIVQAALLGASA